MKAIPGHRFSGRMSPLKVIGFKMSMVACAVAVLAMTTKVATEQGYARDLGDGIGAYLLTTSACLLWIVYAIKRLEENKAYKKAERAHLGNECLRNRARIVWALSKDLRKKELRQFARFRMAVKDRLGT